MDMYWKLKCQHAKCETAKKWKCNVTVNVNMRNVKTQRNGKCERETAKWEC